MANSPPIPSRTSRNEKKTANHPITTATNTISNTPSRAAATSAASASENTYKSTGTDIFAVSPATHRSHRSGEYSRRLSSAPLPLTATSSSFTNTHPSSTSPTTSTPTPTTTSTPTTNLNTPPPPSHLSPSTSPKNISIAASIPSHPTKKPRTSHRSFSSHVSSFPSAAKRHSWRRPRSGSLLAFRARRDGYGDLESGCVPDGRVSGGGVDDGDGDGKVWRGSCGQKDERCAFVEEQGLFLGDDSAGDDRQYHGNSNDNHDKDGTSDDGSDSSSSNTTPSPSPIPKHPSRYPLVPPPLPPPLNNHSCFPLTPPTGTSIPPANDSAIWPSRATQLSRARAHEKASQPAWRLWAHRLNPLRRLGRRQRFVAKATIAVLVVGSAVGVGVGVSGVAGGGAVEVVMMPVGLG